MNNHETAKLATRKPRFFYGYVILIAGFFIFAIMQGSYTSFGIFFKYIIADFDWLRATLSGAHSLSFFMMGVGAVIAGSLNDRFGPRAVMIGGTVLFGAGFLLMSRVDNLWQLYLFYPLIGLGNSASDMVLLSTIARWFVKKRGIMSGISKVGTGVGIMVMSPVAERLIYHYGWRESYVIMAFLVLAVCIVSSFFLQRDPHSRGLLPDGETREPVEADFTLRGLNLHDAAHTWRFWLTCAVFATYFFCIQVVLVHVVPYATDIGIPPAQAALILTVAGGSSIVGRVVTGFAADKIGSTSTVIFCYVLYVISFTMLLWARELWFLYLFAVVYGFCHGGFISIISPLIADLFGTRSHGVLLGVAMFFGTVGGAIGPLLAGYVFDVTESYRIAFILLVAVSFSGLVLSNILKRASS